MATKQGCPTCGSNELESKEETRTHAVPFAQLHSYEVLVHCCQACGDEFEDTEDAFLAADRLAIKESITNILAYLSKRNVSMAYVERALELPQRTIARWKLGDVSASGVALLRLIRTYPWLLEVADAKYNECFAQQKLSMEAYSGHLTQTAAYSVSSGQLMRSSNAMSAKPVSRELGLCV